MFYESGRVGHEFDETRSMAFRYDGIGIKNDLKKSPSTPIACLLKGWNEMLKKSPVKSIMKFNNPLQILPETFQTNPNI